MATVTGRPDFSVTMPDMAASGRAILASYTQATIWAETSLQYLITSDEAHDFAGLLSIFGKEFVDPYGLTEQTVRAYAMIDAVSQLDFAATDNYDDADHVVGAGSKANTGIAGVSSLMGQSRLEIVFNEALLAAPELAGDGSLADYVLLHELAHGFGLLHSQDDERGGQSRPEFGVHLDNEMYTVSSYKTASANGAYGHAVSLMAIDIAAVQALYGDEDYANNGSRYTLTDAGTAELNLAEGRTTIGRAYYCIWDSGGQDTLRYADNGSSVLINLNDATMDTSGVGKEVKSMIAQASRTDFFASLSQDLKDEITDQWHHAGGFFSRVLTEIDGTYEGTDGGFSIAYGAKIENAAGGSADDLLIGNEGANKLNGFGGDDTLVGSLGKDRLIGEAGADWLDGGFGSDTLSGGKGKDWFVFGSGYGEDRIVDFDGKDVIDLTEMDGVERFKDVKACMQNKGDDLEIRFGKDVLVVLDHHKADMTFDHFQI